MMHRVFVPVALALAILVGCGIAFVAAFTVVGEAGVLLVILAVWALIARYRRISPDRQRSDRVS